MNQKGFAQVLIIIGILTVVILSGVYLTGFRKDISLEPNISSTPEISSSSTKLQKPALQESSSPAITQISPKVTVSPTSILRSIQVSGFAYEDRNDDGIFNSDDPKLPNMDITYYDSSNPSVAPGLFTDQNGNFSISYNVKGNLLINPQTYNNFRSRNGALTFSSNASNIAIPFRSASAPVVNQSGVLEGDIFNDTNKNNFRDSGENGIYFMKLYLKDENGNYYNNVENTQTTDPGGHFKYENLPIGKKFTLVLSNPTGAYTMNKTTYNFTLTNTTPTMSNIAIPVIQN